MDLAGSERLDKSGAVGTTLKETQNINKCAPALPPPLHPDAPPGPARPAREPVTPHSRRARCSSHRSLSSLTNVFIAKSNGQGHVPFRDSKLTHLMQPCLSGQVRCLPPLHLPPSKW